MKNLRILLSLILCAIIGGSIIAADKGSSASTAAKARHFYYEGLRFDAMGKTDASYEMFRHAYTLDPNLVEAGAQYGLARLLIDLDTLQSRTELDRSLSMLRKNVDAYPGDYIEGEHYAYLAQLLDTIEETVRVLRRIDSLNPERTSALVGLARAYSAMGDFRNAIAAIDSFERREGPSIDLATTRMSMRLALGDTLAAIADADKLIADNPTDPEYLIIKGQLYDFIQRPDSAIDMYLQAERLDTTAYQAKYALAEAYRDRGDSVNYDRMTYQVLLNDGLDMEEKCEILAAYLQMLITDKQDTARGDHLFSVLTAQYPFEAEVLDLSARYNAAKGNPTLAIENISYALDQDGSNKSYWGQLMTYQLQADKPADAMATYHRALENIEVDNGLKILFATAAQMNKDYDTVVNVYADMIHEVAPTLNVADSIDLSRLRDLNYEDITLISNAFTAIGDAWYQAERHDDAFRAYDNSLLLLPDNALTLNNYAYFLCVQGKDLERAAEMSEKSLRLMPDNPTFMDTYAWILFLQHDYPKALQYQAAAVERTEAEGEASPDLYLHYGDILFMNGKPDEALTYWKKALEINKDDLSEKDIRLLRKKIEHKAFFYD